MILLLRRRKKRRRTNYDIGALKETLGDEASNTVFVAMMMDLPTIEIFLLIQSLMIAVAVAFSLFSRMYAIVTLSVVHGMEHPKILP
jgi:hypothetical protein